MTSKQKAFAEIRALLAEQIEELQKELTSDLVLRNAERHKRIRTLFDQFIQESETESRGSS